MLIYCVQYSADGAFPTCPRFTNSSIVLPILHINIYIYRSHYSTLILNWSINSAQGCMSAIFCHIRNICSHSFTPRQYVHILLSRSTLCSYSFIHRLYVHNLLSHSVYTFTFFHTPTICSQSSLTFSIYVHVVSHPDYMFIIFFHIQHVCSRSFTPRLYVHYLLSHSVCLFTFFHTPTICSQSSFTLST